MPAISLRHRCYLSFDRADESRAQAFREEFDAGGEWLFTRGETIPGYILDGTDVASLGRRMREFYLADSTVTIVLVGQKTWQNRSVEAELIGSLQKSETAQANGLLAIRLLHRSATLRLPERLRLNLESGYARFQLYPDNAFELSGWIDQAYTQRTRGLTLLRNPATLSA